MKYEFIRKVFALSESKVASFYFGRHFHVYYKSGLRVFHKEFLEPANEESRRSFFFGAFLIRSYEATRQAKSEMEEKQKLSTLSTDSMTTILPSRKMYKTKRGAFRFDDSHHREKNK